METINTAIPVMLTILAVIGLSMVLLIIARVLNPKQRVGPVQQMPYESGMDPIHDTRRRFDVRFHLLAIAFLVFDVELLFLYPWAVALHPAPAAQRDLAVASENDIARLTPEKSAMPSNALRNERATEKAAEKDSEAVRMDDVEAAPPRAPVGIEAAVRDRLSPNRHVPFIGAMVFFVLLALGFVYDWRKGVFQWR